MINLDNEKSLNLSSQDRYDIIAFAMDAADDNGFINSFIFERALYCYAIIMLYPEKKDELAPQVAENLIAAWEQFLADGLIEEMVDEYHLDLNTLTEEAQTWYEEYSDWAHSVRGVLDVVQQFSGDIVQGAANRLTSTAKETGVEEMIGIAKD